MFLVKNPPRPTGPVVCPLSLFAKIGSLRATVEQQKTAQVPLGASIVMLVSGVVLIALGLRFKQ
jgi:hypothetical protein